jgi:hypothetical protein
MRQAKPQILPRSECGRASPHAQVYKGMLQYKENWITVALKVMSEDGGEDQSAMFHNEVHLLGSLRHPHIVRLLGACGRAPTACHGMGCHAAPAALKCCLNPWPLTGDSRRSTARNDEACPIWRFVGKTCSSASTLATESTQRVNNHVTDRSL